MKTFLIIGACGTGKTWVMKQLKEALGCNRAVQVGLYHWVTDDLGAVCILGKYEGEIFDGSDRLSMGIMADNVNVVAILSGARFVICEGDRFTNSTFVRDFDPTVIRINGDGKVGRGLRGSEQTDRHIKAIGTRVANMHFDAEVNNSAECLALLSEVAAGKKDIPRKDRTTQPSVQSMFGL